MSAALRDIARAALPIAIGLLVLAVALRAALAMPLEDAERDLARRYVEPLSTWCVGVLGVYAVASIGAGGLSGLSLALTFAMAAAAVWLRWPAAIEAEARAPQAAPEPVAEKTPARPTDGALWAGPAEGQASNHGLWDR